MAHRFQARRVNAGPRRHDSCDPAHPALFLEFPTLVDEHRSAISRGQHAASKKVGLDDFEGARTFDGISSAIADFGVHVKPIRSSVERNAWHRAHESSRLRNPVPFAAYAHAPQIRELDSVG